MGKNSIRKTNEVPAKNTTLLRVFRIIIFIAFVLIVACTILYFVEFNSETKSYFTMHFALPCILFMVGIIAILMAALSIQSISGESKGDNFMIVVGILLVLCSIISLVWSYL